MMPKKSHDSKNYNLKIRGFQIENLVIINYKREDLKASHTLCGAEKGDFPFFLSDKFLYIVKTFCSLSQLSKQCDSTREFLFQAFPLSFPSQRRMKL